MHQEVRTANPAAHGLSENPTGPHQGDTVGHGEISVVEGLAIFRIALRLDHVINVVEHGIGALPAADGVFHGVEGLRKVPPAHSDAENVYPVGIAIIGCWSHGFHRHVASLQIR